MLQSHFYNEYEWEAGCDEAGRGCLAGSVYAVAVIFPRDYENAELNDSKQLTDKKRHQLRRLSNVMPSHGQWESSPLKRLTKSIS